LIFGLAAPHSVMLGQTPAIPEVVTEAKNYNEAVKELLKFQDLTRDLDKKSTLARPEVLRIQTTGNAARNSVPAMKQHLTSAIRQITAAGKWDKVDSLFVAEFAKVNADTAQKERFLEFVKRNGGAKAILQKAAAQVDRLPNEIDQTVRGAQSKMVGLLPGFLVPTVAYASPTVAWSELGCMAVAAAGILGTVAGCIPCGVAAVIGLATGGCV